MYEQFGAAEVGNSGVAEFRLFFPDNALDPTQYARGGPPRITRVRAVGSFQALPWDAATGLELVKEPFAGKGHLYSARTAPLPAGFYDYKYLAEFEGAVPRLVGDPCTKYGGRENQNAGFVIDLRDDLPVRPLKHTRRPLRDQVLYELMVDDFTAGYRRGRAPLDALADKVDHLKSLGVTAVEVMPWTAWPSEAFSWGYEPYAYFSVAHRYTLDPADPTNKVVYLKRFINLCHDADIAVLMDGVFNHAQKDPRPTASPTTTSTATPPTARSPATSWSTSSPPTSTTPTAAPCSSSWTRASTGSTSSRSTASAWTTPRASTSPTTSPSASPRCWPGCATTSPACPTGPAWRRRTSARRWSTPGTTRRSTSSTGSAPPAAGSTPSARTPARC
jgi:hypothetical protein